MSYIASLYAEYGLIAAMLGASVKIAFWVYIIRLIENRKEEAEA